MVGSMLGFIRNQLSLSQAILMLSPSSNGRTEAGNTVGRSKMADDWRCSRLGVVGFN